MKHSIYSPRQAAEFLGVSESSLKRWCDDGRIKTRKTPGGHRKIDGRDLLEFARANNYSVALRVTEDERDLSQGETDKPLLSAASRLTEALLKGDEQSARDIVFELVKQDIAISQIFDEVIAAALVEIGVQWECASAEEYQERLSCEICRRILFEMRQAIASHPDGPVAIGATLAGDIYQIPTTMVELVLRANGFHATSLGSSIPAKSLVQAIETSKPKVAWLSVSHIQDIEDFIHEISSVARICQVNRIALVVGGRALHSEIRRRISYSVFCDTMQHLDAFAQSFIDGNVANMNPKTSGIRK